METKRFQKSQQIYIRGTLTATSGLFLKITIFFFINFSPTLSLLVCVNKKRSEIWKVCVEILRGKYIETEREIFRGKKLRGFCLRGIWKAFDVSRFNGILKSKTQLLTPCSKYCSSCASGKYNFHNFVFR